jgi:hypothetical protein
MYNNLNLCFEVDIRIYFKLDWLERERERKKEENMKNTIRIEII